MSSVRTNSLQFGNNGAVFINDTDTHTGNFGLFYPLSTCVFDTITSKPGKNEIENASDMSGVSVLAGAPIYGWLTSIKLASGYGIAYKSPPE